MIQYYSLYHYDTDKELSRIHKILRNNCATYECSWSAGLYVGLQLSVVTDKLLNELSRLVNYSRYTFDACWLVISSVMTFLKTLSHVITYLRALK